MGIHKTEGIILSSADWSESSQTLTVFTPDKGKLALNVKGSRVLNGKRGRPLRFARLEFSCYLREDAESGYLSDVDPVEVWLFERDGQLGRLTFASASLELLNNLLIAVDPQPAAYQITLSFLRMTDRIEKKRLPGLFAGYILRLVSLLGYRPNLSGCASCGNEAELPDDDNEYRVLLSVARGGIICDNCRDKVQMEQHLIGLPIPFYRKLVQLLQSSMEEASQIKVCISDLNMFIDMITAILKYHAGEMRQIKSFAFLDKLARAVKNYEA